MEIMGLTTTPTNTSTSTNPDTENETPPAIAQPNKSLSFTNGALKKHSLHHHPVVVVTYRECLKNHAAGLGVHAVDGCGEFMPSPTANPTDPTSLKCAACGCHRNFHRREDDPPTTTTQFPDFRRHPPILPPPARRSSPLSSPSPPPPQPSYYPSAPHMLLALSTAAPLDHQPTMNNHPVATLVTPMAAKAENPNGRKRVRTKFSQEQKEKMLSFSEKLGWKMRKSDEGLVEDFCNETGVGKGVLKIWMHNNKHSSGKRDINSSTTTTTTTNFNNISNSNGRLLTFDNNNNHHQGENNNDIHLHVSTSGSPSSA